jgi:hypothetical protein
MRYLTAVVFFLISSIDSIAQPGFGPEIGIGMSSMHFAPALEFTAASTSSIFSGKIGGIADLKLTKHTYLQPGIFLSRKGQSRDFSFYQSDSVNLFVQQTLTINYVDVPVTLIYKSGIQGKGRVILGLGVTPSYIIGGRNKEHDKGVSNNAPFDNTYNKRITNGIPVSMFDIGVNIIGGYELPTGLFFKLYYTSGVTDIGLGTEIDKNRMWGLSAGYLFGKGRNINKEAGDLIDKSTD